jgi:dTDP-4-dehydrorhamnose reductase
MKRLFVTGTSGFVGGHIAAIAGSDWKVFGTFQYNTFNLPGVEKIRMDLADLSQIRDTIREIRPNVIVHCAAMTNLDVVQTDRKTGWRINVESTRVIAEESSKLDARMIFTSTDMVFDGKRGNYSEDDPPTPVNVYGESKVAAEEILSRTLPDFVIARLALVYGRPVTGGSSFSEFIRSRIAAKQEVPLFADQYRTPILVNALAKLLLELASNEFIGTIHLGGPERIDRFTFAQKMAACNGLSTQGFRPVSLFDEMPDAQRPRDVSLNIRKAQMLFATPIPDIAEGVLYA